MKLSENMCINYRWKRNVSTGRQNDDSESAKTTLHIFVQLYAVRLSSFNSLNL